MNTPALSSWIGAGPVTCKRPADAEKPQSAVPGLSSALVAAGMITLVCGVTRAALVRARPSATNFERQNAPPASHTPNAVWAAVSESSEDVVATF
jgi:hypothetical protein